MQGIAVQASVGGAAGGVEEWPREEQPVMEWPVEERCGTTSYLAGSNAMHKEEATGKPG